MTPPLPLLTRRRLAVLALALVAASLGACGRRGPVELPPETQARGAILRAEARAARAAPRPAPGAPETSLPPPPIPGTIGNRPPAQYPFPLDPLL
ncbi:LPS translocon maturation chaperone LptM [Methylocystis sp.]|uniref:LPS translocon maturation chaperone LptM n=1 Tax=Methylocystis sp. TaxID=1911079 RepID=UPI003DA540CF